MQKYVCIHGHFYQPPRENPWLEQIEFQESAAPYHDWNERITAECYAPNATARILSPEQRIERIGSNYAHISFNFGPTLLTWMLEKIPEIHDAIVDADRQSRERFSGHGSALAQVYNHMILPLANDRDKRTQVLWGIRDFEHRFRRVPEGLWLSETAADTPTLEILAENGIRFTILSPHQAARVRSLDSEEWVDVSGGRIDTKRPYIVRLPSGRSIAVFFYDAVVSQAIAFEKLLNSGEALAQRLLGAFAPDRGEDQLVHVATDGESYGHHHTYGEMALAYALHHIEAKGLARLTNYGEYLATHPPAHEVQIHEKSAWSCSHGVGRWMADCGCNSGGHRGWNQHWRGPLREALDRLRDQIGPCFESKARTLLKDPWAARDDYIAVLLNRSEESRNAFLARHALRSLDAAEQVTVLKLMEMQRHAMLMYTSCGWFFDELSGIETVQVIQYAARVIQLAEEVFQQPFEPAFLSALEACPSNIVEHCNGRCIYGKFVKPAMIDWRRAVAHYAISSVFHEHFDGERIFLYTFHEQHRQVATLGKAALAVGSVRVTSEVTRETASLSYAVLYMGEHNLTGGVSEFRSEAQLRHAAAELRAAFEAADFLQTIRLIDRHFGPSCYSLKSLFKDEQRRVLERILASTSADLESRYRRIAERYTPLITFLGDIGRTLLPGIQQASDFVLRVDLRRQFEAEHVHLRRLRHLVDEARRRSPQAFDPDLSFAVKKKMEGMMQRIAANPGDATTVRHLTQIADIVMPLPLGLNLWKVQNTYWELLQRTVPDLQSRARAGEKRAERSLQHLLALGVRLNFAVDRYRV